MSDEISFDDFLKVDIRVGEVVRAEPVEDGASLPVGCQAPSTSSCRVFDFLQAHHGS